VITSLHLIQNLSQEIPDIDSFPEKYYSPPAFFFTPLQPVLHTFKTLLFLKIIVSLSANHLLIIIIREHCHIAIFLSLFAEKECSKQKAWFFPLLPLSSPINYPPSCDHAYDTLSLHTIGKLSNRNCLSDKIDPATSIILLYVM
jgi:hypothetical protein